LGKKGPCMADKGRGVSGKRKKDPNRKRIPLLLMQFFTGESGVKA